MPYSYHMLKYDLKIIFHGYETHHMHHESLFPAILAQAHSNSTSHVKGNHHSTLPVSSIRKSQLQILTQGREITSIGV
jgi:hypothetical protein